MITDEKLERLPERLERQQRECEAMRQAIAAYTGPMTKCPRVSRLTCCPGDGYRHKANRKRHPRAIRRILRNAFRGRWVD